MKMASLTKWILLLVTLYSLYISFVLRVHLIDSRITAAALRIAELEVVHDWPHSQDTPSHRAYIEGAAPGLRRLLRTFSHEKGRGRYINCKVLKNLNKWGVLSNPNKDELSALTSELLDSDRSSDIAKIDFPFLPYWVLGYPPNPYLD
jgi:hypothetical protein